jgi:hypothetical protein
MGPIAQKVLMCSLALFIANPLFGGASISSPPSSPSTPPAPEVTPDPTPEPVVTSNSEGGSPSGADAPSTGISSSQGLMGGMGAVAGLGGIGGTAAAAVTGLLVAKKVVGNKLYDEIKSRKIKKSQVMGEENKVYNEIYEASKSIETLEDGLKTEKVVVHVPGRVYPGKKSIEFGIRNHKKESSFLEKKANEAFNESTKKKGWRKVTSALNPFRSSEEAEHKQKIRAAKRLGKAAAKREGKGTAK